MKTCSSCGLSCEILEPVVGAAVFRGEAARPARPWLGAARAGATRQFDYLRLGT